MSSQLELDLEPDRRRLPWSRVLGGLRASGGLILAWAPVWMPAALVLQIALLGFLPAREEARRLDRATAQVQEREAALAAEAADLERHRHMLEDDVYRERLRKSRARGEGGRLFEEPESAR